MSSWVQMGYKEKHGQGVQKEFAKRGEQQL